MPQAPPSHPSGSASGYVFNTNLGYVDEDSEGELFADDQDEFESCIDPTEGVEGPTQWEDTYVQAPSSEDQER